MSVSAPNYITAFQTDAAAYLAADEMMMHVHVIREAARLNPAGVTFEKVVNEALMGKIMVNGKKGLALLVYCPEGKPMSRENAGLSTEFDMTIRAVENSSLNADPKYGTGMSCEDLLLEAMLLMQRWTPLKGHSMRVEDFYKVDLEEAGMWAWEFSVKLHDACKGREKCDTPKIVLDDGIATITTPSLDAVIYYTVDGTLPTPSNGTIYESPIECGEIELIRAMAWQSGMRGSDCANHEFS